MASERLWEPSPARVAATRLDAFRRQASPRAGRALPDYPALHRWSIDDPSAFWSEVWDGCGMVGDKGTVVVEPGEWMATTRFFTEARLNVAENLLSRTGSDPAVIALDEQGARRTISWDELRQHSAAVAGALRSLGLVAGDRVAAWLPNGVEAMVLMLGAASIGAVFTSCSPDFGTQGVLDRFGQIRPKVLVAADRYRYGGKEFDCLDRLAEIRAGLPSVVATAIVSSDRVDPPPGTERWDDFVGRGVGAAFEPERLPFDHPWYVLYSSGTTGVPKCIVHRAGGVLLQHLKEHQLHCDIRPGDRVLYFTTTGWMMWNWLASTLASGATAVCYDGSPSHPSIDALFDIVEREQLSLLGISAKFIESLRKSGASPSTTHELGSLRTICSTGSPLSIEGFRYVYDAIKRDVHLASISGGTDLCACLVGGDPTSAVYAGEIQRPALGMAIDVWSDDRTSLASTPGAAGELVCTAPFPSMPLGFWADGGDGFPDPSEPGPRYRAAYFDRFGAPGDAERVWAQGDFASWTGHGGVVIHGRSDATLNPGGVRIGTAEIYRAVELLPEVVESLVFAQQVGGDVRIVLLVRVAEGTALDEDLVRAIKQRVRVACSPRHVPAVVAAVDDLPRTRSNKLVELAVSDAVNGRPVRNTEAIANPEAIDAIVALPELQI